MLSLGVIGTGNMGSALIRGWSKRKDIYILAYDLDRERLKRVEKSCNIQSSESPQEVIEKSTHVVLAIKPGQVKEFLNSHGEKFTKEKCLISICAGISLDKLKKWAPLLTHIVRVMPNTPALVGKGLFAMCFSKKTSQEHREIAVGLFKELGEVYLLEERLFDGYTGLIGSGPAYVAYFMEAMIDAGVKLGLSRDRALSMVIGLFEGTTHLIKELSISPSLIREMVTSPGGTTIWGLSHFDKCALKGHIMEGIEMAAQRSKELG